MFNISNVDILSIRVTLLSTCAHAGNAIVSQAPCDAS